MSKVPPKKIVVKEGLNLINKTQFKEKKLEKRGNPLKKPVIMDKPLTLEELNFLKERHKNYLTLEPAEKSKYVSLFLRGVRINQIKLDHESGTIEAFVNMGIEA
ncbi:MAG: hypothetical protein V1824_00930, partial [archaeon]